MIIGVPREVKDHETRVGLVPSGVIHLHESGHRVLVQSGAGEGSSIPDDEYTHAGAEVVAAAAEVWGRADLVVKVKEPQPSEYGFLRRGLILFTYLHLAPARELTDRLLQAGVTGVAYETIEEPDGSLPLLERGGAFIAVGGLHLAGKEGLVELFRAAGYTVTPIE